MKVLFAGGNGYHFMKHFPWVICIKATGEQVWFITFSKEEKILIQFF